MGYPLRFDDRAEQTVQYDARGSVDDFGGEMARYTELAAQAKERCSGILDIRYGMGRAERLDLFPARAAAQPSPLFVYIHGGYWHSQTKEDAPSMAPAFVGTGIAVATLEYTLMPEATLPEIVREVRSAIAWLHGHGAAYGIDPGRIFVGGSSAGGHLAGMLALSGWQTSYGLPEDVVAGVLGLSGLYDLRPLCEININDWMRLTEGQAALYSPALHLPERGPRLVLSVGGRETRGFKNQTLSFVERCRERGLDVTLVEDTGNTHFSLVNELSDPGSALFRATTGMIAAA